jgi:hypothetical protein
MGAGTSKVNNKLDQQAPHNNFNDPRKSSTIEVAAPQKTLPGIILRFPQGDERTANASRLAPRVNIPT